MPREPKIYQRLPGRGAHWVETFKLYQGPDHLLQVISTGYNERYKRFYFADITALTCCQSTRRSFWNWVLGLPLVLLGVIWSSIVASLAGIGPAELITGAIGVTLLGVPLLINNLLGPTCVTRVHTTVQSERLWTLNRLRRARQILARLKPLIESVQGPVTPEQLAATPVPASATASPALTAASAPAVTAEPTVAVTRYAGGTHQLLFWLLLADIPFTVLDLTFQTNWTQLLGVMVFAAAAIAAVAAVIRQRGAELPLLLQRLPWVCLGVFAVLLVVGVVYGTYLAISEGRTTTLSQAMVRDRFTMTLSVISTTLSGLQGLVGLIALRKFRQNAPAELAATPDESVPGPS